MKLYLKSKYVNELNPSDIKIVNLKSNNIKIKNNDKNHLIKFYAHWCPHCHDPDLREMLEVLGENLKKYNIEVSSFNCAENNKHSDISDFLGVSSYPTIMYKDIKNNKLVKFEGKRDIKSIIDFLFKNKK